MAEIICEECKAAVSDESGYCTECGFPFGGGQTEVKAAAEAEVDAEARVVQPETVVVTPLDIITRSLNSVGVEIKELQDRVAEVRQELVSSSSLSADNTQRMLAEITRRLDGVVSAQNEMKNSLLPDPAKKSKKELLAAFYKTLNSPNSMFEYMFYICVVLLVFVVVNLFLVAYVVTLVRE